MQRRPVLAAALAVVPALGHAYLRRWTRAFAWLALLAGSALVFVGLSDAGLPASAGGAFADPTAALGVRLVLPLAVVLALSAADAYLLARRESRGTGVVCPRCRHDVDLSLGFCWYCAVEFDYVQKRRR